MNFVPKKLISIDDKCFITSHDAHLSHLVYICCLFSCQYYFTRFSILSKTMYEHFISCDHVSGF